MSRFFDHRLLQQAQAERPRLVATVILGALGGAATVAAALALSQVVDGAFLRGWDLQRALPWLLALIAAAAARSLFVWAGDVAANRVALQVKNDLRERLMAHVLALGPHFTQRERTGELVNTAVEGVEALDAYFSQYLPQLALAAIIPCTLLAFVLPRDLLSAVVLVLTAPLIPVFMALIGGAADTLAQRQWTALSRMSAHFLDILQGLTTLKLFNRSREQIALIRQVTGQHRDATLRVLRVAFLSALVLELIGSLSTAIIAVEVGLRLLYGKMLFRDALFVLILAPEFYLPLRLLGARFHAGLAGVTAAHRIFEVLETPLPGPGMQETHVQHGGTQDAAISFQNVHYSYPGRDLPALNGVSFAIRPGERVALVGASGAGKSTIAHLLLGFVQPSKGVIAGSLRPRPEAMPHPQSAWVPQSPYLFANSVLDNIRLGRPEASLADVRRAAVAAAADEFICGLPQGYDTLLGEQGVRLSGGQAQRIALARAFLLDAPLVVLDEATAHLDAETEVAVQAAMERLLPGRTALLIAHRLHTLRCVDRILVLDAGRVVEQGTHEELLASRGVYWRLVTAGAALQNGERPGANPAPPSPPMDRVDPHAGFAAGADAIPLPVSSPAAAPPGFWAVLQRLLGLLAPFWPWAALSVLLGFLTVGSSMGLLAFSAWIIAAAALQPSIAVLQLAIVGVRFFGIVRGLLRYLERLASHQVTFRLLAELRAWFYATIEPGAPANLSMYRSGDLLSRVVADIGTLEHFYIRAVGPPLAAALTGLLLALFLSSYALSLAMVGLLCFALAGLGLPGLSLVLDRRSGERLAERRALLNSALVDGIQGVADLRAYAAADRHTAQVAALSVGLGRVQGRVAAVAALNNALGSLLTTLAVAGVLALAIPLVRAGQLPGIHLAVLALATLAAFEAVQPLPQAAQYLRVTLAAGKRLFAVAQTAARAPLPVAGARMPTRRPEDASLAISIRGLTMQYAPGRMPPDAPVLRGISLDVPVGSRVIMTGASGAGKTTLAQVLLRFWEYDSGEVRLYGADLRSFDPEEIRRLIGVVAQRTHLFNASVRDNLLLASPSATQIEMEEAARTAQIHDVIMSLPQGYDTWIGEQGWQLSGGERQRLAIARALLKNAPILILDEPGANLDPVTERALWIALIPLMAGRTTILITHRLPEPPLAGELVVLEAGRVVARSPQTGR